MTQDGGPHLAREPGRTIPLSPVQEWFFAQLPVTPASYTQSNVMRVPATVSQASLEAAMRRLAVRHDALRLRFRHDAGHGWSQWIDEDPQIPVARYAVPPDDATAYEATVSSACEELRAAIDLADGPVAAAALIEGARDDERDVVLVVHHLAVDTVSWAVLGDELRLMLGEPGAGDVELPGATTTGAEWSSLLRSSAESWADEVPAWTALSGARRGAFSATVAAGEPGGAAPDRPRRVTTSLDASATRALLEAAVAGGVRIDHVLLGGVGAAICPLLGAEAVIVDVETHGRVEDIDGADLSRTVGWLTSISPFAVGGPRVPVLDEARRVSDQASSVRHGGLGYGVLRWQRRDPRLASRESAAVLFTYLGRSSGAQAAWRPAPGAEERTAFRASPYLLTVNAWVEDERLFIDWWTPSWLPPGSALPAAADVLLAQLRAVASSVASGGDAAGGKAASTVPATPTEQLILTAWTEVLDEAAPWNAHLSRAASYGIDDDFFLVGGDSIHMIQIASRLRQALGIRVPLKAIRDFPTVRQLATKVDAVVAGGETF